MRPVSALSSERDNFTVCYCNHIFVIKPYIATYSLGFALCMFLSLFMFVYVGRDPSVGDLWRFHKTPKGRRPQFLTIVMSSKLFSCEENGVAEGLLDVREPANL